MPRKRTVRRVRKVQAVSKRVAAVSSFDLFNRLRLGESYMSLLLGIVVVIVGAFLISSVVRNKTFQLPKGMHREISSTRTERNVSEKPKTVLTKPKTYTVLAGDNLWKISKAVYKSGYNWVDIAKANNLENPQIITPGTTLTLPDVKPKVLAQGSQAANQISGSSYVIQKGDSLWDIAVRAYGSGFKWTELAKVNNLSEPDLIFSGNELKIPRG